MNRQYRATYSNGDTTTIEAPTADVASRAALRERMGSGVRVALVEPRSGLAAGDLAQLAMVRGGFVLLKVVGIEPDGDDYVIHGRVTSRDRARCGYPYGAGLALRPSAFLSSRNRKDSR